MRRREEGVELPIGKERIERTEISIGGRSEHPRRHLTSLLAFDHPPKRQHQQSDHHIGDILGSMLMTTIHNEFDVDDGQGPQVIT
jgi:hypothetical protein